MQKIIAVFDGLKYSKSTRDYAVTLAKQSGAQLVGVFLEDPAYTSYKIYELLLKKGVSPAKLNAYEQKDRSTRLAAVADFERLCRKEKLTYAVHHDRKLAILEVKHESIYADLLIIDASETFIHYEEKLPTGFIRDLLNDVQCPVLLVPTRYRPVEKVVMLYDGEPSSVFAIKMFSYTIPAFIDFPVEILSVKNMNNTLHLPDNTLMKEFIRRHFPKVVYRVLKGVPETEIPRHLTAKNENTLVVLGAYRRGRVSRWFRQSMADVLMKQLKLPLFIAHNK